MKKSNYGFCIGIVLIITVTFGCSKKSSESLVVIPPHRVAINKDTLIDLSGPFNNTLESYVTGGYTDQVSYNPGDTIAFYIDFKVPDKLKAVLPLRNAALQVVDSIKGVAFKQPEYGGNKSTDGYHYNANFGYLIPLNFKSGVYVVASRGHEIVFTIKSATKDEPITIVYPSNTDAAYNNMGGQSLYVGPKADSVSFLRPKVSSSTPLQFFASQFFNWVCTQHYNVNYISDMDLDNYDNFKNSKLLIIAGHSEYWTRAARVNFDRFISEGHHSLILSGNTMWWQVRYSFDNTKLICYKGNNDPINNALLKTNLWLTPYLNYPIINSIGADHAHGGNGLESTSQGPDRSWKGYKIINGNSPILQHTGLKDNDIISIPTSEYDGTELISQTPPIQPNNSILKFNKVAIIGYDYGSYQPPYPTTTVGTFMVFQKTPSSGWIINTASTDWCSPRGFGGASSQQIIQITQNCINLLLNDTPIL